MACHSWHMSATHASDVVRRDASPGVFTRRQGLMALGLLGPATLLVACSSEDTPAASTTLSAEPAAPPLDATVAGQEALLIAHYDAVLDTLTGDQSDLRDALTSVRDQHAAHREALGGGGEPVLEDLPAQPSVSSLMAAEKDASKARIKSCVAATDPELARVLAFIAASEASHVPFLKDLA